MYIKYYLEVCPEVCLREGAMLGLFFSRPDDSPEDWLCLDGQSGYVLKAGQLSSENFPNWRSELGLKQTQFSTCRSSYYNNPS